MPASKNPSSYPAEYEELLTTTYNHLLVAGGDYVLRLESAKTAMWLKARLFSFFAALRASNSRPDLINMANFLSLRCEDSNLIVYRRSDSRDARVIRDALGLKEGFADAREKVIRPQTAKEKLDELRKSK